MMDGKTTKTISIQKGEYLKQRDRILSALEAGGVDNWDGYADCFEEEEEEEVDLREMLYDAK